ncbi:MAG TPA: hypothetical protein EYP98_11395, partial [Planctomycetes bacterium]|nr:hypothetical protein [Planctomycetota bacterium]
MCDHGRTSPLAAPNGANSLKLVAFSTSTSTSIRPGALLDADTVLDFTHEAAGLPSLSNFLEACDLTHPFAAAARDLVKKAQDGGERARLQQAGALHARSDVTLAAPVPRPGKIICIGLNYRDHAEEQGAELPKAPLVFSKFSNCVLPPGGTIIIPPGSTQTDFEAELGVVIGKRATRVNKADAMDYVLGYCNFHDVYEDTGARPMTMAEKIISSHLVSADAGAAYVKPGD